MTSPASQSPDRSVRIDSVEVTAASETGATHWQRHRESDDAVGWSGADGKSVLATVAIADGHSDQRCVRSRVGAEFVVAAAMALPADTVDANALIATLIADWRRRVDQHLADHPLTVADFDSRNGGGGTNARVAYGATAALCRVTKNAITIARVGDGDVIAVAGDGEAHRLAVAPREPGDITESISQPDAYQVARCAVIPAEAAPVLLVLATDGFDNAYPSDESMLRAARELAQLRRESGQPIGSEALSRWARDAAEVSGDDATVAAIWIETTR